MNLSLYDVHCHAYERMETVGAIEMLQTERLALMGTRVEDWPLVSQLSIRYPSRVVPAFGLHPWYAEATLKSGDEWHAELEGYLRTFPQAIVGEIGMDKVAKDPVTGEVYSWEAQMKVFNQQMDLAVLLGRPVSLHWVKAAEVLLKVLKERGKDRLPPRIMLHSYNQSVETLKAILKLPIADRIYWSISAAISLRSGKSGEWIPLIPEDRLLLESDLHEVESVDAAMESVALRVAEIRGVTVEELARKTWENAVGFYKME